MVSNDYSPMDQEPLLNLEALVPVGSIAVCVDDRRPVDMTQFDLDQVFVRPEQADIGPKFLAGSAIAVPLLVETAPEDQDLNTEEILGYMFEASCELGMEVGIHMDNHHDEMELSQIAALVKRILQGDVNVDISGCGFWGAVNSSENLLGFSARGVKFFKDNPRIFQMIIRMGGRLSVLGGHHASKESGQAWAVRNREKDKTVSREKIRQQGRVAPYAHDDALLSDYFEALANAVGKAGKQQWAENIRQHGNDLNEAWLQVAAGLLVGKELQPIN